MVKTPKEACDIAGKQTSNALDAASDMARHLSKSSDSTTVVVACVVGASVALTAAVVTQLACISGALWSIVDRIDDQIAEDEGG